MRQKISKVLAVIWGISVFVLVFAGGLTALGFITGFIIGGENGGSVMSFIYNEIFPKIIFASSVLVVLGWIKMEIDGEQELTAGAKKTKKTAKQKN